MMDSGKARRRPLRLPGFDYRETGAYFVTLVTKERVSRFGTVVDGVLKTNRLGEIVSSTWRDLSERFPLLRPDVLVVMPDHLHGVLVIDPVGAGFPGPVSLANDEDRGAETAPLQERGAETVPLRAPGVETVPLRELGAVRPSLGQVVAYFKYQSTKHINLLLGTPGMPIWQRNYYEHVIRSETEYALACAYIEANPVRWTLAHEDADPALWSGDFRMRIEH